MREEGGWEEDEEEAEEAIVPNSPRGGSKSLGTKRKSFMEKARDSFKHTFGSFSSSRSSSSVIVSKIIFTLFFKFFLINLLKT